MHDSITRQLDPLSIANHRLTPGYASSDKFQCTPPEHGIKLWDAPASGERRSRIVWKNAQRLFDFRKPGGLLQGSFTPAGRVTMARNIF